MIAVDDAPATSDADPAHGFPPPRLDERADRSLRRRISDRLHIDEYHLTVLAAPPIPSGGGSHVDSGRLGVHNPMGVRWTVVDGRRPRGDLERQAGAALPTDGVVGPSNLRPNRIRWRLTREAPDHTQVVDLAVNLWWEFGAAADGVLFVPRCWVDVPIGEFAPGFDVQLVVHAMSPRIVGTNAVLPIRLDGTITDAVGIETFDWRLAVRGDGSTTAWTSNAR